jgi:hypothetical protein
MPGSGSESRVCATSQKPGAGRNMDGTSGAAKTPRTQLGSESTSDLLGHPSLPGTPREGIR